jgi:uncharacterized protein YfeS
MNVSFEWFEEDHVQVDETRTLLNKCAADLNVELAQRQCCDIGAWPQTARFQVRFNDQFLSVPESYSADRDSELWSTRIAVAQAQWANSDDVEKRRLLLALSLNALIWLGYKIPAGNENLIAFRRGFGDLLILGGSHSSPEFKAWLKSRAPVKSDEDEDSWDNPKKAHANARALMTEDWMWNITSDQSPFGNDTGWDMMDGLCEWLEENPRKNVVAYFQEVVDSYPQSTTWNGNAEAEILKINTTDFVSFQIREELVISFAFGLLVKRGYIPDEIRIHALGAFNRMLMPVLKDFAWGQERVRAMISILNRVPIKPRQKPAQ